MSRLAHELRLSHRRYDTSRAFGVQHTIDSTVDVDVESTDLVEAWAELFSRLPTDTYAAVKEAWRKVGK